MWAIGITGGVGSGKSEILRYMREKYGSRVLLTDDCAKEMEKKGGALFAPVCALLEKQDKGPFLTEEGEINKAAMAAMIFEDPLILQKIDAVVHPAVNSFVKEEVARERARGELEFFLVESALMIENNYRAFLDELWYIYCEESVRRERLAQSRGYSQEKITRIIGNQITEEAFRDGCDYTIDNSGSLEEVFADIDEHIRRLRGKGNSNEI